MITLQGLVFICHGICEHSGRYTPVAKKFNDAGFEVYAMDHRGNNLLFYIEWIGHGRSDGYRNYINSMNSVIQDQCDFIEYIHNQRPELPIFVMVLF